MIPVTILGSTGSIGRQTLEILENNKHFEVYGLSCYANTQLLEKQIQKFHPKVVAVGDEKISVRFKKKLKNSSIKVLSGIKGITELAAYAGTKKIVIGMSGEEALHPLLAAIRTKNDIILANKEVVVCHGAKIRKEVSKTGARIIPADSELCAIFQCLEYRLEHHLKYELNHHLEYGEQYNLKHGLEHGQEFYLKHRWNKKNGKADEKSTSIKKLDNERRGNVVRITDGLLEQVEEAIRQDSFFGDLRKNGKCKQEGICMFDASSIERVVLTCSGGPFFKKKRNELEHVTLEEALKHPVWSMGKKISIDSATLVNKGLEVIETHYLFGLPYESIQVVIHPESIVHALVYFHDGEVLAVIHQPDMKIPLEYALLFGENIEPRYQKKKNIQNGPLHFYFVDHETFPALKSSYEAGNKGQTEEKRYYLANKKRLEYFCRGEIHFRKLLKRL